MRSIYPWAAATLTSLACGAACASDNASADRGGFYIGVNAGVGTPNGRQSTRTHDSSGSLGDGVTCSDLALTPGRARWRHTYAACSGRRHG
jgi:hypothetical protein